MGWRTSPEPDETTEEPKDEPAKDENVRRPSVAEESEAPSSVPPEKLARMLAEDSGPIVSARRSLIDPLGPFVFPKRHRDGAWRCRIVHFGEGEPFTLPRRPLDQPIVCVWGNEKKVCKWSLCCFSVHGMLRRRVLEIVECVAFDRFILGLIVVNSLMLAGYQYREPGSAYNTFCDDTADKIFIAFFATEMFLKILAWGCVWDRNTYLRDAWNWLDSFVVVTGFVDMFGGSSGFASLRIFRVLRPLRSLNSLPNMKYVVKTVLRSFKGMRDVSIMSIFIFTILAILGLTFWRGIFYRQCRKEAAPSLDRNGTCWRWDPIGEPRLCGGANSCEGGGFCGGHLWDLEAAFRPVFPGDDHKGLPWCGDGYLSDTPIDQPRKVFPETDFIHFDHLGGAFLVLFQSMTMEEWVNIMYKVQDGDSWLGASVFFISLIFSASFFVLNVALAVIQEAYETVIKQSEIVVSTKAKPIVNEEDKPLWLDHPIVRRAHRLVFSERFSSTIMLFIVMNTFTMMLEFFPPNVLLFKHLERAEYVFVVVFTLEMVLMLVAIGPVRYVKSPITLLDGVIVVFSFVEILSSDPGAWRALRGFRLFRIFFKLAKWFISLRVLLMSMMRTAVKLAEYIVLFLVLLYVFTLLFMSVFANKYDFDPEGTQRIENGAEPWCTGFGYQGPKNVECIPYSNFDTFLPAVVTIFQVMTLESWNSVMYDGMRSGSGNFFFFFLLIVFGQILTLNLFLTILIDTFERCSQELDERARQRRQKNKHGKAPRNRANSLLAAWGKSQGAASQPTSPMDEKAVATTASTAAAAAAAAAAVEGGASSRTSPPASRNDDEQEVRISSRHPSTASSAKRKASGHSQVSSRGVANAVAGDGSDSPGFIGDNQALPGQLDCEEPEAGEASVLPPGADRSKQSEADGNAQEHRSAAQAAIDSGSESESDLGAEMIGCGSFKTGRRKPRVRILGEVRSNGDESEPLRGGDLESHGTSSVPASPKQGRSSTRTDRASRSSVTSYIRSSWRGSFFSSWSSSAPTSWFSSDGPFWPFASTWFMARSVWIREDDQRWPWGYSLFIFHEENLIRRYAKRIILFPAFDKIILVAIGLSTITMIMENPLSNPLDTDQVFLKWADTVFVGIFMSEMFLKLIARGFVWGVTPYLANPWNWLDGIVVVISAWSLLAGSGSTGFIKTLRILRALRPLRAISKNENLKAVVQTIFKSLPDLGHLSLVSFMFLVVFAIFFVSRLNGLLYQCVQGQGVVFLGEPDDFVTPLCLGSQASESACMRGRPEFNPEEQPSYTWLDSTCAASGCGERTSQWVRPTEDTPICVGRCDPLHRGDNPAPESLCPPPLTSTTQLPSVCPDLPANRTISIDEQRGLDYNAAMQRQLVMPCGGPTGGCRAAFCPNGGADAETCQSICKEHPTFCSRTCQAQPESVDCLACRAECEAWCQCDHYCEPLVKDAARCVEQGGQWEHLINQNFDNFFNALMSLFEIMTTEGWVGVLHSASDTTSRYMQPARYNRPLNILLLMFYMFMSNMFLLNLSVGVVVRNFIELKESRSDQRLSPEQQKWIHSLDSLYGRTHFFVMTNLHRLGPFRRKVFALVTSKEFDRSIMGCIAINTTFLAMQSFPHPTQWWTSMLEYASYSFTGIFFVEATLKLTALGKRYWIDRWNRFDFFCVVSSLFGILASEFFGFRVNSVLSVIRIFRIARLFRLLRFLKGLNKIFMALLASLPKLGNVIMLLALMLVLYSILGVQLFAKVKFGEALNVHGNFRSFRVAFVTLFRCITGEAWNDMMHDLSRNARDWARKGDWCSPAELFDTENEDVFKLLQERCLIEQPNVCGEQFPVPFAAKIFFVTFTLGLTFIVANLVIAVILDGYTEGVQAIAEAEVIDTCIRLWKEHDPDCTEFIRVSNVFTYVDEAVRTASDKASKRNDDSKMQVNIPILKQRSNSFGVDLTTIPMRYVNTLACDMVITSGFMVHFLHVVPTVLRLVFAGTDQRKLRELESDIAKQKVQRKKESRLKQLHMEAAEEMGEAVDLRLLVAAAKIQMRFRERRQNSSGHTLSAKTEARGKDAAASDGAGLTASGEADAMASSEPIP